MKKKLIKLKDKIIKKVKRIKEEKMISNFFKDKSSSTDFIREVLKYYKSLLNKEDNAINLEEVINIVSILDEKLKKLKYNVNMKLWIDDLLLSLMEV